MAETSTKPYLIRALYEWCSDNGYTPYIAVAVDERTIVPREFVRNGEIVLNVSPLATNHLQIANDLVSFQARFGGVARELSIPVENVISIYARETGHGMAFEVTRHVSQVADLMPALSDDQIVGDFPAGEIEPRAVVNAVHPAVLGVMGANYGNAR